jgi:hypothetical protein
VKDATKCADRENNWIYRPDPTTYDEEHEEDEHSHKEPVPEIPPMRKAYTVRFS